MAKKKDEDKKPPVEIPEEPTLEDLEKYVRATAKTDGVTRLQGATGKRIISGVSSGSMDLNYALSGSPLVGYAWGRIVEAYGPEGCGKTTLALHFITECQRLKVPTFYEDAEHVLDPDYAKALGIDLSKMSFNQPDNGEQALEVVEAAVRAGYKGIVVDSVAALVPRAEIEGNMGDSHIGLQARLMGQAMRKLAGIVHRKQAIVFFINQVRMKVGVMFGNPETTTGGNALKFYASYRLDMRAPREGKIVRKDLVNEVEIGKKVNVVAVKNKVFPPYRRASFSLVYGEGIDRVTDAGLFLDKMGGFTPDKKGTKRIVLLDKSYTVNTLIAAMADNADLRKCVVSRIRELMEGK